MIEEWRCVVGYEGFYEVSNFGQVRGIDRMLRDGRLWRGRILYQKTGDRGHKSVRLCKNMDKLFVGVHCLVLQSFVGPCPFGMEGAHNDGDPSNNTPLNLRWDTPKGNSADRSRHGTLLIGERNCLAKLSTDNVKEIFRRHFCGEKGKDIAVVMGVTPANISAIISKKTWRHIGECHE